MGSAATKVVGAAVVAAVALSAGSFWVGSWVEQVFRDSAEAATQYGIKVTVVDYQRGVFGAVARTEVTFPGAGGDEPVTIAFNHRIEHGPVPAFTSAARIHSEPQPSGDPTEQFSELLGSDAFVGQPVTIDSTFDWAGGHRHRIVLPRKFEATFGSDKEGGSKVSGEEIDGEFEVFPGQARQKAKFIIGGFSLSRGISDSIRVDRGTLDCEFRMDGGQLLGWIAKVNVERVATEGNVKNTINGIALDSEANLSDGTLSVTAKLAVAGIVREKETRVVINDIRTSFLFGHLGVDALKGIFSDVLQAEDEQAALKLFQERWTMLLQYHPVFAVQDVSAHWQEGELSGGFRIEYSGAGISGLDDIALADVAADWQLNLPRALAARFVGEQMYEDGIEAEEFDDGESGAEEPAAAKPTKEQIDKHITALIEDGVLLEKNGTLSLDAIFRKGELTLNGKVAPVESLLILSPF
ncbi:MAG: YdgA family protein [Azoarcus sp.]|jgi:hypothetical protein|nr:YdgA family protein [Azoarcus sp.]